MQRSEFGIADDVFVFCSFTNCEKVEPGIFDDWMHILRQVPQSILWLRASAPQARVNLRREASSRGVDPGRLVFTERLPKDQHLARHSLADLFLDTPVFNALTTVVDSLWVGIPVLTCPGRAFCARVAASLLTSAGLCDLIAADLDDYKARAIRLATESRGVQEGQAPGGGGKQDISAV